MENTILIVDDEQNIVVALKRTFIDDPYKIFSANSGMEGINILKQQSMKIIISDEKMPGMSGDELLSIVKKEFPEVIRIMLTGHGTIETAMKAVNNGEIYRFFTKPWDDIELKLAVRSAIEKYDLEEENSRLLRTVKRQAASLKLLEKNHPGITKLEEDEGGNFILPEVSEEELSEIIKHCGVKFS